MPYDIDTDLDFLIDKFRATLIGSAIGDSLGFPVEGMDKKTIRKYFPNGVKEFSRAPKDYWLDTTQSERCKLEPGQYTDDTQSTLAVAGSLVKESGFNGESIANELAKINYRFPGRNTLKAISNIKNGVNWQKSGIQDAISDGSAMRVSPIGLFYSDQPDFVSHFAIESSRITHSSSVAEAASRATALMIAYSLDGELTNDEKKHVARIDHTYIDSNLKELRAGSAPFQVKLRNILLREKNILSFYNRKKMTDAISVVPDAINIYMKTPRNFEKSVLKAVNIGGDTDTRASLVGAMSGALNGMKGIPKKFTKDLENVEYISSLAEELAELAIYSGGTIDRTYEVEEMNIPYNLDKPRDDTLAF